MTVFNLKTASGNIAKNQFVVTDGTMFTFRSYKSVICVYNRPSATIVVDEKWNYSATTRKYFYQFLREYTGHNVRSKQDFLQLAKTNNLVTLK